MIHSFKKNYTKAESLNFLRYFEKKLNFKIPEFIYFTKKNGQIRKLTGKLHFKDLENRTTNPDKFLIVIDFKITKQTYRTDRTRPEFRNINLETIYRLKVNKKDYYRKDLLK